MAIGDITLIAALSSILSFSAGLWASTYLQDRGTRQRHLGLVRALLAEVRRIRRESGGQSGAYVPITVFGMRPSVPGLSPWVQSVLTDIALTSPVVVEKFLNLELHLDNLRKFDRVQTAVDQQGPAKKEAVNAAEEAYEKAPLENLSDAMVKVFKAKQQVERHERNAELADFTFERAFKDVQTTLNELDTILSKLEKDLVGGLWTHLPWVRH